MRTYLIGELFKSNVRAIEFVHVYIRKSYVQSIVVFPNNKKIKFILYSILILRSWVKDENL